MSFQTFLVIFFKKARLDAIEVLTRAFLGFHGGFIGEPLNRGNEKQRNYTNATPCAVQTEIYDILFNNKCEYVSNIKTKVATGEGIIELSKHFSP